ncbi:triose-phosphate transporter family-domain-containing protein [Gaertneriomyces semiglobifer]|nr:triose-phosphate transporter family-domain-containing protein [Gaertneriomyces semiglobifer]
MGAANMDEIKDDTTLTEERLLPMSRDDASSLDPKPPSKATFLSKMTTASTSQLHPAFYICIWIAFSSAVILFNKYILYSAGFPFPIFLTTWHLIFATIATRVLSKTTNLVKGAQDVKISWNIWAKAIVPIGATFSLSLIFSNLAYLYLSVAFIQMLKATTPVAVLIIGYALRVSKPDRDVLLKVLLIVFGVLVASYGEFDFVLIGVIFQSLGIVCEATRLVLVQKLLSQYKMDPLTSLYYFAPVCAALNGITCLIFEGKHLTIAAITNVGLFTLLANAVIAFGLNVAVVFLIGKTSSVVMCLSGILKDILLVFASLLIWSTVVTPLQFFGYALALVGLVWYKEPAAFAPITNYIQNTQGRSPGKQIFAKVALVGLVFMLLGFLSYISHPAAIYDKDVGPQLRLGNDDPAALPHKAGSTMDIVISSYDESPQSMKRTIDALISHPAIAKRNPRVILYNKDRKQVKDTLKTVTGADVVIQLPNRGREAATYMWHILSQYDNIAEHTLFIQADPNLIFERGELSKLISDRLSTFQENVGFLTLGETDILSTRDMHLLAGWPRIGQVLSTVAGQVLPDEVVVSYNGQFIVSRNRVHFRPRATYQQLLDLLQADANHWIHKEKAGSTPSNPFFSKYVERSYHALFNCMNVEVVRQGCHKRKLCGCSDS